VGLPLDLLLGEEPIVEGRGDGGVPDLQLAGLVKGCASTGRPMVGIVGLAVGRHGPGETIGCTD